MCDPLPTGNKHDAVDQITFTMPVMGASPAESKKNQSRAFATACLIPWRRIPSSCGVFNDFNDPSERPPLPPSLALQLSCRSVGCNRPSPTRPPAGYPLDALWSRFHRVLAQGHRARSYEARSGGALRLLRSASDLEAYTRDRRKCLGKKAGCNFTAAILGVEGSHGLDADIDNLETLHDTGFRLMGLHHFHDNDAGGSRHGHDRGGLSEWGVALVEQLEERGWVVDLAHSSQEVIRDVLKMATKCVVALRCGLG